MYSPRDRGRKYLRNGLGWPQVLHSPPTENSQTLHRYKNRRAYVGENLKQHGEYFEMRDGRTPVLTILYLRVAFQRNPATTCIRAFRCCHNPRAWIYTCVRDDCVEVPILEGREDDGTRVPRPYK